MNMRMLLLTLWMMLGMTLQAQTYGQLWKDVEQMEQKDLPKSALAEAKKIYAKAKSERNVPQMMKAYLTMMACRGSIAPDSLAVDVKGLEAWAGKAGTSMPDKAVLYSILGEITMKDDFAKGDRYLRLSLKDSLELVDYPAEKLVPMVETGETSRLYFDNNLYDLLARRAIQLWGRNQWNSRQEETRRTIQETYQSLLHIYKVRKMRSAWLLTALDAYPQADEKQLREWIDGFADLDVCAEVYLRLAQGMFREDEPAACLSLLREGISRYPNYNRINALKDEEREILAPRLNFSVNYSYPEEPIAVRVNHRNLQGFTVKFYRLNLLAESPSLSKVSPTNVTKYGTLLRQEHFDLPATPDYRERADTLLLKPLDAGIYYAVAIPDGHRDIVRGALLQVTGLQVMHRALPDDRQEIVVLDKRDGHPVPDARVNIYTTEDAGFVWKEGHRVNAEGIVMLTNGKVRNIYLQAQTETDKAMPIRQAWLGNNQYMVDDKTEEHVDLFTDRAIYRPGQTLHYSGIAYDQRKDDVRAKEGQSYTIALLDADNKEVATQEVRTDAFGSLSGMFELPKSGKMGRWRLRTGRGTTSFQVEEYKRPTFEVTFDTVRTSYQAGDSIQVTGVARTFAGAPVQGAKVKYAVARLENNFWRMPGVETNRVTGETVTDDEGHFEVPVHFLPVQEGVRSWYCTYEVSADVTGLAGETQAGRLALPLGSSSLRLYIADGEGTVFIKEQMKPLIFHVTNLLDVPMKVDVNYQVLSEGKPMLQGKTVSNEAFVPKDIYALPSGKYQLKARVRDEQGKEVEQAMTFTLLSLDDKRLPEGMDVWCYQSSEEFGADGTSTVYFGSSEKDVYLFYDIMYGDNRIERKHIVFSDTLMAFRYTYREEYGDGLQCTFAYLKNGELYVRNLSVKKPKPDKTLQLKWKTFRDKLQPGQRETWTLSVLLPDGKPADAQLMMTMYDASLDRLMPFAWRFGLNFERRLPGAYWRNVNIPYAYWGFSFPIKALKYHPLTYSRLDVPLGVAVEERGLRMYKAGANVAGVRNMAAQVAYEEETVALDASVGEGATGKGAENQLRSNFAETAFFYPQLRTDADGEVNIEFTLPESLTEWKFMGLAHTKEMDYGDITAKAIASKEFMLQPNLPRFVRVGDETNVMASLVNLSDKDIQGSVRMELLDPATEKVIWTQKRPFTVKASGTGQVSFGFEVSDKYEGVTVRMIADGGTFSDGEQRYLAVLSDKQKLTESVLLNVNGAGTSTFSLESLFNHHSKTVSRPKMWVEFTGNPLWYAIQALKVVKHPETDNALSWSVAYYANTLLAHLAKTEPRIADSLHVEGIGENISETILKLKDLQGKDGAWSWFKGMSGSRYMTTQIVEQMARLQKMTGGLEDAEVLGMYRRAWNYLSKEVLEEVRQMKDLEKEGAKDLLPSELALQYLYIGALDNHLSSQSDMKDYLLDKLSKNNGVLTIYGKALGAIVLQASGKPDRAKDFLQSLLQYSVMTETMGRYFDTPKAYYSWFSYKIPTQVMAIEAVHFVAREEKTQEELKQWLLKQKQTQVWNTPIATTDAVYALLTTGKDWLAYTGAVEIKIGKEVVRTPNDALGYVQQEVSGKVMDIRKVTVEKKTDGLGWGAVYADFEEDLNKVSTHGNGLTIKRSVFKDGKLVSGQDALSVGDKLTIRLTVSADRDMDFVQVKDEYAACLEPANALSGYHWSSGGGYYQEIRDASTSFFVERMSKGVCSFEYDVYVKATGNYQWGIASVQSVYAPDFNGHGDSESLLIK